MQSPGWRTLHRLHAIFAIALVCSFLVSTEAFAGSWQTHSGKLISLRQKITAFEDEIKHLIELKRHTQDERQLRQITQAMADKHKEMAETAREYDEERLHVRFKHPDKDATQERQYSRFDVKTLKEIEDEMGIDGRLDRVKTRVLATFPVPESDQPKKSKDPHSKRRPASQGDDDEDSLERIKLVK